MWMEQKSMEAGACWAVKSVGGWWWERGRGVERWRGVGRWKKIQIVSLKFSFFERINEFLR